MKLIINIMGLVLASLISNATAFAATCQPGEFQSVFGGDCYATYEEWIANVWSWGMAIIIPLSVLVLTAAGVLYMTSEGDSTRMTTAKKLIMGVVSGIAVLVLARFILMGVIGLNEDQYNSEGSSGPQVIPTNPNPSSPGGSGGGTSTGGGNGGGGGGGGAD